MRRNWNLQTMTVVMISMVLFIGLSINTAVLIFIASGKYKSALQSKVIGIGEELIIGHVKVYLNLNIPIRFIEGINEQFAAIVSKDQDIAYSMIVDLKGKILFHNDISMIGKEMTDKVPTDNVSSDKLFITQINSFYDVSLPINDKKEKLVGTLHLGMKSSSLHAQIYELIFWAVGISSIIILLGTIAGWMLGYRIINRLNYVIKGLKESFQYIVASSETVSVSSQLLAEATARQADNSEEILSSLEEISLKTKSNAENANEANKIVRDSRSDFDEAIEIISELGKSMNDISTASDETQKIVKTINEIAFQTNLLALNAAVEAARAGEAGSGFAVVAEEVRNLAMRTSEAAKITAEQIEGIARKINDGSIHVQRVDKAFEKIIPNSDKIGGLVNRIAAASNEQTQNIEELKTSMNKMNQIIQQNASNAEESASTPEEMNAQAEQMKIFIENLVTVVGGKDKK